jgi:hypothetical protein
MSMNLFQASHEWQSRPADQRFESLDALYAYTQSMRDNAAQSTINMGRLTAEPTGNQLGLIGEAGQRARPPAIGSKITFRYQELTDGGAPRFPVFVREFISN